MAADCVAPDRLADAASRDAGRHRRHDDGAPVRPLSGLRHRHGARRRRARRSSKPIRSLETPESQAALLVSDDPAETARTRRRACWTSSRAARARRCCSAWPATGSAATWPTWTPTPTWCECLDTPQQRADFVKLVDDRNPLMADKIVKWHAEGKSLFVAVGSLHMTGRVGLPALLKARGFQVERVRVPDAPSLGRADDAPARRRIIDLTPLHEVSMSDIPNFAKLVPGFDFLQGLVKNAGSALPSMGQWVAPTLNPEELQKRIDELKTVQFWLEQNAKMLGTTIQALEVQRMTLSTLKTMNVQMTDLRDAMKVAPVASAGSAASAAAGSVANSFGADALMQAARNAMGNIAGMAKPAAAAPRNRRRRPSPRRRPRRRRKAEPTRAGRRGLGRRRPDAMVGRAHQAVHAAGRHAR